MSLDNFKAGQKTLDQPLYFGAASFVDNKIGRIIEYLDTFFNNNNIIFFTTDHGHYSGAHRLDKKGPALYEEVINIPLIIRYPGVVKSDTKYNGLVSHMDIMPTLLEAAGMSIPESMEGKSLLPVLKNPNKNLHDAVFTEFNRFCVNSEGVFGFQPIRSIITSRYKLVINLNDRDELYDLQNDPGELDNLINRINCKEVRDKLHDRLMEEMKISRDPFKGSIWKNRKWRIRKKQFVFGDKGTLPRKEDGFLPDSYNYWTGMPEQ
ncbi:MAG: sulfatase-like hydrolase/transferase [Spirochaetales bacterium]|nr:sulfatase-like hydrolase/transferase [Spirochaetales bacterium]